MLPVQQRLHSTLRAALACCSAAAAFSVCLHCAPYRPPYLSYPQKTARFGGLAPSAVSSAAKTSAGQLAYTSSWPSSTSPKAAPQTSHSPVAAKIGAAPVAASGPDQQRRPGTAEAAGVSGGYDAAAPDDGLDAHLLPRLMVPLVQPPGSVPRAVQIQR